MQSQRQTVTNRLADVIHIIHIGSKSGMLTVERGEGKTVEEGFIKFVHGRVVEARVGMYNGLAALHYLTTWQTCRFSLQSQSANEVASAHSTQLLLPSTTTAKDTSFQRQSDARVQSQAPIRLQAGEEALQQGRSMLSRTHRRLLLLIDGHRESTGLARLMGRSVVEIQTLLNELEANGFIRM
jgi:hypothetical protein